MNMKPHACFLRYCALIVPHRFLDFYNRDKELFEMYEIDRVPDFYTVKHLQKVLRYEYNMAVKSQLFRFYVFEKENPCRIIGTVCIHNIAPAFYGSCEIGYKIFQ